MIDCEVLCAIYKNYKNLFANFEKLKYVKYNSISAPALAQ